MRTLKFCDKLTTGLLAFWLMQSATVFAGILTYADRVSFTAATVGLSQIDFEGIAPVNGYVWEDTGSYTKNNVTFTASGQGNLFVIDENFYVNQVVPIPYNLGNGAFLQESSLAPASLRIYLSNNITAAGFDFGTFDDSTSQVSITLSSGDIFSASAPLPTSNFFGFTSDTAISSIFLEISQGNRRNALNLDTFTFGTSKGKDNVPEPGILALLFSLVPFYGFHFRRKMGKKEVLAA